MSGRWIATYRLQLHAGFPLDAAGRILPYLARLGISHVYLSPCLQAVPGSQHGYDVADPSRIADDLGGEPAWTRFVQTARENELEILLDIVPNHMAATQDNPWWDDVLARGPFSEYASYFDIRIAAHQPFRVHLCTLARAYGEALEAGELGVEIKGGRPRLKHYDNTWPLGPASWGELLADAPSDNGRDECFSDLERLLGRSDPDDADRELYRRSTARAEQLLADAGAQGRLEAAIDHLRDPGRLDRVLQRQFFVLHGWKLSGELTNYRRFFDVGSLSGIRTELPQVMAATHARIETMVSRGEVDGLRIDHPDGLRDPLTYFERLREMLPDGRVYVEKILENDERLMDDWPIDGTVGYDFLAKVNRLWMDDQRIDTLTATYSDFTGHPVNFAALVREKKREIVESTFSADLERLAVAAIKSARAGWRTRDISPRHLREALARVTVALPVYRTYRTAETLHEEDRRVVTEAVQSARIGSPEIDSAAFDFLLALLTKPRLDEIDVDFVAQWQQLAPAVMAKGVEDTTFYCFDRLVSCNEVGAQASLVGISADKFHEFCHYLSDRWPNNMLATSTHDNKRSEDVRTRISVLSEIPDRWSEALHAWSQLTAPAWKNRTPDRHAEYLLYQTLIGAWPISQERCWEYMLKACREAKIRTSWHEPNTGYEENIRGFVDGVFRTPEFVASLESFIQPLILPGRVNSLSQTLIKMMVLGVPDFYQGTELWDLSLVDPDNRRPVDFELRSTLVGRCKHLAAEATIRDWDSGLPKLWLISNVLALRRERPREFSHQSQYQPLVAQGSHLGNLLAFRRGENLIVVVPRLTMSLSGDWGDTRLPLPRGAWRNRFTGAMLQGAVGPADLFEAFPVALLVREEA
ncbi:MAG: 1,4-alpha-D-glucan 1-alpha-D-glucosylmutase [Gammaproteobacteria bacterium]|nr:1,4-alpha-D-glucan 1-alpha-D-glucosylmutase [Gammaproteobacteria bacterium]